MMAPVHRVDGRGANPCDGRVVIDGSKALWNGMMIAGALAALAFATPGAVLFFLASTYLTLLLGHSIGMHRLTIHRSGDAVPWLKRLLVYLGTLVGIGGPAQIIRIHDCRDWAQRQAECHDFFSHRRGFLRDLSWQLFHRFDFERPPVITVEPRWARDAFYRHLSRHWRTHQIVLAAILLGAGGLLWLLWGVCARVALSTVGHWSVTHVCHNPGPARFAVIGAGVQASDLRAPLAGWLTHGECWHSHHHAFPASARIGLDPGQIDPAAWIIERLAALGWATRVNGPRAAALRDDLMEASDRPVHPA